MAEKPMLSPVDPSQIQEAVDTIVQSFGHPSEVSVRYTIADGTKRTLIEVNTDEETQRYELTYDGQHDDSEPSLTRLD